MFDTCTIYRMPQRSPEWHKVRKGRLTASEAGAWLAERPACRLTVEQIKAKLDAIGCDYKKSLKRDELLAFLPPEMHELSLTEKTIEARKRAIAKCLGAISGCEVPDEFQVDPDGPPPRNRSLWAIWNGIRQEPDAIADFCKATGESVEQVGFCLHESSAVGCSPDGLLKGHEVGLELKCPLPETHVRWFLDGGLPDEHRDQVHFSMAVTGAEGWWFQSYCPGLPSLRVYVERDPYTEAMTQGIADFAIELSAARQRMAEAWDKQNDLHHPAGGDAESNKTRPSGLGT